MRTKWCPPRPVQAFIRGSDARLEPWQPWRTGPTLVESISIHIQTTFLLTSPRCPSKFWTLATEMWVSLPGNGASRLTVLVRTRKGPVGPDKEVYLAPRVWRLIRGQSLKQECGGGGFSATSSSDDPPSLLFFRLVHHALHAAKFVT